MRRTPTDDHDKLAEPPHRERAESTATDPSTHRAQPTGARIIPLRPSSRADGAEPASRAAPRPSRRDTRAVCARCGLRDDCPSSRADGGPCPLESDTFPELADPARVPAVLRDVLRAELRTFFRAKRLEARSGAKIDAEASKLALALFKQVESYLEICQRVAGPARNADDTAPPARLFPSLEAALAASGAGLFSEVPAAEARERLRARYLRALREEDAILRAVQGELPRD